MGELGMGIITPGSQSRDSHPIYHAVCKLWAIHTGSAVVETVIRYLHWAIAALVYLGVRPV